jgi:cell division septation protein DedD
MRAVVQRVKEANVKVDGKVVGSIEQGVLVLLGVADGDTDADADALAEKIVDLRSVSSRFSGTAVRAGAPALPRRLSQPKRNACTSGSSIWPVDATLKWQRANFVR